MKRILLLYLSIAFLFILMNFYLGKSFGTEIDSQVQYRWGDSTLEDAKLSKNWNSIKNINDIADKENEFMWYRFQLPEDLSCNKECSLYINEIYQNYEVYEEGSKIYTFGDMKTFNGWNLNLIRLDTNSNGKEIYIKVQSNYHRIGLKGAIYVDKEFNIIVNIIKQDMLKLIIPILMIAIGFFFIVLALRQKENLYYIWFALFLIVYTGVYIGRTNIKFFIYENPLFWVELRLISLYIVPVLFVIFLERFIGIYKRIFRFVWIMHLLLFIYIVVMVKSELNSIEQFYSLYDKVLTVSMITVMTVVYLSSRRSKDYKILASGFIIYLLFGMYDVLVTLNVVPYMEYAVAQYGLFVLILCILSVHSDRYAEMYTNIELYSRELSAKNEELLRLSKIKDEFLTNTSHELRTPLNGIIGISESILSGIGGPINQVIHKNVNIIISSAMRLSNLVNDILDYSKLKHMEIELKKAPIDLASIVDVVMVLSDPLAKNKKLEMVNRIPSNLFVNGDENRIQQVFFNLIGNAIKYTPQGTITVTAEEEGNFVKISVSDTGIGIPSDKFELIFQSFEQLDSSETRQYSGTGLGLSITKSLIELHGGTIFVGSEIDVGSRFIFTLPVVTEQSELFLEQHQYINNNITLTDFPSEIEVGKEDLPEEKVKILVVDDDPTNVQVIINHLSLKNWGTVVAHNGIDAINIIDTEHIDLVLLDVMMPKITGFEVTKRIREQHLPNELPIILLTAKNSMNDFIHGFQAGANDYLTKPFSKEELIARIQVHLDVSKASAELRTIKEAVQTGTSYMRHAIKNDIGTINLFSEKIREYAITNNIESLIKDTSIVINKNKHLLEIIKRINILTSDVMLYKEHGNPREIIVSLLQSLNPKFDEKHIKVNVRGNESTVLQYDHVHMKEVISNVFQNAIEAMDLGGSLDINISETESTCVVSISDSGYGVPNEHLPHIFELYYSTKKREGNFGLGLHYCQRVMSKHGGKIDVSTSENGTTVSLTLRKEQAEVISWTG